MDTKHLENIGESFIVSCLLDENILVAKPFFDRLGTDLIGFTSIDDKARFCRIQCKYRELKTTTSIQVNCTYVVGAFVLFVYIKSSGKRHFYCLLPDDINRIFKLKNEIYRISITKNILNSLDCDRTIIFNSEKVLQIFKLMKDSSPNKEIFHLFKGVHKNFKKYSKAQEKHIKLSKILHELEVNSIKKKALDEQIKLLQEYHDFMKKYHEEQKNKGSNV